MRLMYVRPPPPEPQMPAGLVELMEGMTKEVLKHNPPDVYQFCARHMQKLLEIRDGRAPKIPLTLEQKIQRAQEKVRKKSEERRRKYDEAMKLLSENSTTANQVPDRCTVSDTVSSEENLQKKQVLVTKTVNDDLVPVHDNLDDKEVKISIERSEAIPVTSNESVKEADKLLEIIETAEDMILNDETGTLTERTVETKLPTEHLKIDADVNKDEVVEIIRKPRKVDSTEERTDSGKTVESKHSSSSFDELIENEALPKEEDLNTVSTGTAEIVIEGDKNSSERKGYEDEILLKNDVRETSEAAVKLTNYTDDAIKENESQGETTSGELNSILVDEAISSENIETTKRLSEDSDNPKPEQFFLDDKSEKSVSVACENNESKISDEVNMDIFDNVKQNAITSKVSIDEGVNIQDNAVMEQEPSVGATTVMDENHGTIRTGSLEKGNVVIIDESITFGNAVDTSVKQIGSDESINPEIHNEDIVCPLNLEFSEALQTSTSDLKTEDEQLVDGASINDIIKLADENSASASVDNKVISTDSTKDYSHPETNDVHINDSVDKLPIKLKDTADTEPANVELKNDKSDDAAFLNQDLHQILESPNDKVHLANEDIHDKLKGENTERKQSPEIKLEFTDSFENIPKNNKDKQCIVSEQICQKKTVSLLEVPINDVLDEKSNISHSEDKLLATAAIDSQENAANHEGHTNVLPTHDPNEFRTLGDDKITLTDTKISVAAGEDINESVGGDPQIIDMHFVEEPCNENNAPNRAVDIHHKPTSGPEHLLAKIEHEEISDETNSVVTEPDTSLNVVALVATEIVVMNDVEEQFEHSDSTPNTMDLETAAITIQKHFRNFMFKSKCSTFEDSINDDHNSTDEDTDKEQIEYTGDSIINKERRTLGLNRMESVLQTVNEEKSLSLSTDDSVSSAATVIQARVRGFLIRKRLSSKTTSISQANSDGRSTSSDEQQKEKKVLNIHIVPEGEHFHSRDESILESIDLSLDGSPPSSTNRHPLGYDKSEPRKQLKREDAVQFQSFSPPSNNSAKLSQETELLIEPAETIEHQKNVNLTVSENAHDVDAGSCDTTPTKSTTMETVIEVHHDNKPDNTPFDANAVNLEDLERNNSDESDVVTPLDDKSSTDSDSTSKLIHSGEFHDIVLAPSPTQISRCSTTVVRGE